MARGAGEPHQWLAGTDDGVKAALKERMGMQRVGTCGVEEAGRVDVYVNGMGRSVSFENHSQWKLNNSPTLPCTNLSSPHLKARTDTNPLKSSHHTSSPSRAHRLSSSHRYLPMATSDRPSG